MRRKQERQLRGQQQQPMEAAQARWVFFWLYLCLHQYFFC